MKKIDEQLIYNLANLSLIESTYDEEDSYYIYNTYKNIYPGYIDYCYPPIQLDITQTIFNDYSLFYGRIQESLNSKPHTSPFPLGVIRFMIDSQLNYHKYYAPKRKPGYVVEGYFWTNGFVRRIRQDKNKDFETYEISCLLSPSAAYLMNLSSPDKYV